MSDDEYGVDIRTQLTYPHSEEFEYFTKLEVIDMDAEARKDIESGEGFEVSAPMSSIKKDIKNPNGIYSSKFGQKLGDVNPFADRYSCQCGTLTGRINNGITCPMCQTKVKYVDDNFKMFAWMILKDEYHIIHPKFYDSLEYIFGPSDYDIDRKKKKPSQKTKKINKPSKLKNMLNYSPEVDQDGIARECEFKPKDEPFYGIGMSEFYNRFDEILDYYYQKNPKKKDYVDEIKEYRHLVFCHSIPVYTTHLRPVDIRNSEMYFEPANGLYNMMNKHVHRINTDKRKMDKNKKIKDSELFKLQMKYMELCEEVLNGLSGKFGQLRSLVGGRYNFSSRAVIRQDPTLRIDQIKLPYAMLVKTLQQRIINVLIRTYNMNPSEAYKIWSDALAEKDDRVAQIIDMIIEQSTKELGGLPCILNRNPTIN